MAGTFILKNSKSDKEQTIFLRYHIGLRKYFKYSTRKKILPVEWNKKSNTPIKKKHLKDIRDTLPKYQEFIDEVVDDASKKQIQVTPEYLKEKFDRRFRQISGNEITFFDVLNEFVVEKKEAREISDDTIARYVNIGKILTDFEKKKRYKITFERINDVFYSKFLAYSREIKKHQNNTVGRNIGFLKTILNWATKRGYNQNTAYHDFKQPKADTNEVALSEEEVMLLYNHDFGKRKSLSKARDIFVFGCFTSMRFSDYSKVKKSRIRDGHIVITQVKTKSVLNIPLNKYSRAILEKWDYNIPSISNQKLNQYIKEACEIVGIDEEVEKVGYIGKERIEESFHKYELIGSHTARRTFITIALDKGMQPDVVMRITGHKSYKDFAKYIKTSKAHVQNEMDKLFG